MADNRESLEAVMKRLNKNANSAIMSKGVPNKSYEWLSFGSPAADYCTYGGIVEGRLTEICGPESGGKTTTALILTGQYQRKHPDRTVVYVDIEQTFDPIWATKLGVNVDKLYLLQPEENTAEQVYDMLLEIARTGEVGLMVIDSVAVLVPGVIYEESMTKYNIGGIAKSLTLFCNKFIPIMKKYNLTTIAINQVRDDMDSMYNQYITPGGKGFKHACSIRIMVTQGDKFNAQDVLISKTAENAAYHKVKLRVLKNKVTPPDRPNGYYTLNYVKGVDIMMDTIATAAQFNLLIQGGAYFTVIDTETGEIVKSAEGKDLKFCGKRAMCDYFEAHEDDYNKLKASTYQALCKING